MRVGDDAREDDTSRHRLVMHLGSLGTFFRAQEEVQDIARAREAACSVAHMQIGAMRGNSVRDKGECVQSMGTYLKDDNTMVMARWNTVKTCSNCQRNGHVNRFCRIRARDLRKNTKAKKHLCTKTGAVFESISHTSSSSHRNAWCKKEMAEPGCYHALQLQKSDSIMRKRSEPQD